MILPEAPNSATRPGVVWAGCAPDPTTVIGSAAGAWPRMRTATDSPVASFICEATVRFQTRSYSRSWSPDRPVAAGRRNESPAGRMASCASWALLTLLV